MKANCDFKREKYQHEEHEVMFHYNDRIEQITSHFNHFFFSIVVGDGWLVGGGGDGGGASVVVIH